MSNISLANLSSKKSAKERMIPQASDYKSLVDSCYKYSDDGLLFRRKCLMDKTSVDTVNQSNLSTAEFGAHVLRTDHADNFKDRDQFKAANSDGATVTSNFLMA